MQKDQIINIAYAEQHIAVRQGIISLLNSYGGVKTIIEADNGKDLLLQITRSKTKPDICILDINMPVMNGLETLIALKKKWPEIGVLVLTISYPDIVIMNMIMAGANGYMLKSCNPQEIKEAIVWIYNNGVYFSGIVTRSYFNAVQHKEIKLPHFTEHELDVLKRCCSNLSYEQMAQDMGTTTRSVNGLRDSLFKKLNINNRVSLAMFAIQTGLVNIEEPIFNGKKFLATK